MYCGLYNKECVCSVCGYIHVSRALDYNQCQHMIFNPKDKEEIKDETETIQTRRETYKG